MIRSWVGRILGAGAVVATVVAVGAAGASAAPHGDQLRQVHFGYTDSATPRQAHDVDDGEFPIGTRVDAAGTSHTSRVYVTFDLAPYAGRKTYDSTVYFREAGATDCPKRAYQLWRVKALSGTPTWKTTPKALGLVGELTSAPSYCPQDFSFDVSTVVADALRQHQRYLSLELRIADQVEADPAYGRTLRYGFNMGFVEYNTPPTVDGVHLFNGGTSCSTLKPYPRLADPRLEAVGVDADEADHNALVTDYAVWPKSAPAERQVFTSNPSGSSGRVNPVTVPGTALVDGQTYGWQARVSDGVDVSAWSPKCYFVYDGTAPSVPTVTELAPPAIGEPVRLSLSGNHDRDVAGFQFMWDNVGVNTCSLGAGDYGQMVCPDVFARPNVVRADTPGGTATILTNPPAGPGRLYLRSVDLAGRVSATTLYQALARSTGPTVRPDGGDPFWGQPVTLRLAPNPAVTSPVTDYTYQLEFDGEVLRVNADEDGAATISFTPDPQRSVLNVQVWSQHANGFVSTPTTWQVYFGTWPGIRSADYPLDAESGAAGTPGTFEFGPPIDWTDTVAYRYTFDSGVTTEEVPAAADGTASVTWTPAEAGYYLLEVTAVRADGSTSDPNWHTFAVAGGA